MDISIADAHNHLSALLKQLEQGPIRITRLGDGETVGVLISRQVYEDLRQVKAQRLFAAVHPKLNWVISIKDYPGEKS